MSIENVPRRPTVLIILDGVGVSARQEDNGVYLAHTPNLDSFLDSHTPYTILQASEEPVGLPAGQMGNSEVGHLTLGAGTVLQQDLVRIDQSIKDNRFQNNPVFLDTIERARRNNRRVHIMGLMSDGGVHSHYRHTIALINLLSVHKVRPVLHMITDGRDCAPRSALRFLPELESALRTAQGEIATVIGRYYAMDRDSNWDRIEKAWQAIIHGEGQTCLAAGDAIRQSYESDISDEFIQPYCLEGVTPFVPGEELICVNFRSDRVRQIVTAITASHFEHFVRKPDEARDEYTPRKASCMTHYSNELDLPVAFAPLEPQVTLGSVVAAHGINQFRCAETEKYAHVTYFFNGGKEQPYPGEARCLIPSPRVSTYDKAPQMSAHAVANSVIEALDQETYGLIVVNFANGDMVGHTARQNAVIEAVETLDKEVSRVIKEALALDYSIIVTADHGNCEEMIDTRTGEPHTQHTGNPVPCFVFDKEHWYLKSGESIASIAPTILELMGLPVPIEMHGISLLSKEERDGQDWQKWA